MLKAEKRPEGRILSVCRQADFLEMITDLGPMRIEPKRADIFRVRLSPSTLLERTGDGMLPVKDLSDWTWEMTGDEVILRTASVHLHISRRDSSIAYYRTDHTLLFRETGRSMEAFMAPMPSQETGTSFLETVHTADGDKQVLRASGNTRRLYHTRLNLAFQDRECLYGLGQSEEGRLNLRGSTRYLHQANRKISIPLLTSSMGWGILLATDGAGIFHDDAYGSCLYTEADEEMDYYVLGGGSMDAVVDAYRFLTGKAAMLPRWALGYIQSQERYETEDELLRIAEGYRQRHICLDCVVLDWFSWKGNAWGQKTLDPERFPHMSETLGKLHDMHVQFMISIWPNMARDCDNCLDFARYGLLLPGSEVYDAFDARARKLYWEQAEQGLFHHGVDAWWCDSCEPFTPEWAHVEKPDPACMYQEYVQTCSQSIPMQRINAYALFHARTIWEGQRGSSAQRVVNLTRSAHTGSQRYGVICWSGDISASWQTLAAQVREGLNFCASGLPFWTLDIGAFFVRRGSAWFWDGEYEQGMDDPAYRELFVRWYQFGSMLPVFRGHGTDIRRELWELDSGDRSYYLAVLRANRLRYLLLPCLSSLMGHVWLDNATMMRLLAFDFPDDPDALNCEDEYMLGPDLLVCPVTDPAVDGRSLRSLYLPKGQGWYDLMDGTWYAGGQHLTLDISLDIMPVFIREGAVLPVCPGLENAYDMHADRTELCIWPGRDGRLEYYEDAGNGYGYEQGEYAVTTITWKDELARLEIRRPNADFSWFAKKWEPKTHVMGSGRGLRQLYGL